MGYDPNLPGTYKQQALQEYYKDIAAGRVVASIPAMESYVKRYKTQRYGKPSVAGYTTPAPGLTKAGKGWTGTAYEGYRAPISRSAKEQEQLQRKQAMLSSPSASWGSQKAYEQRYGEYILSGGKPVAPAGQILQSSLAQRQQEATQYQAMQNQAKQVSATPMLTAAMERTSFDYQYDLGKPISKQEFLATRRSPDQFASVRRAAPITAPFYERASGLSAGLQKGLESRIGYSETAHPVIKFASGAGSLATGLPAFVGMGAVGLEGEYRRLDKTPVWARPIAFTQDFTKGLKGIGGELYTTAKARPIETAGMLTAMIVGPKMIKSAKVKITETVKFRGKTYVPPETIIEPQVMSGAERFPLAPRGTTGAELVTEFKTSRFKLPGTETKIGGWHATPEEFAKTTLTQVGTSEGKGLYISPSTSPHFWKVGKDFKLFGFEGAPETPAGIWLETKGITRSPVSTRMSVAAQNVFLTSKAMKGKGYISAAFEKGIKPEKEAIIPPETPISRVRFEQFTKWQGKKVPLMEYTTKVKAPEPPASYPFDFFGGESGITVTRGAKGMQLVNVGATGAAGLTLASMTAGAKQETYGDLVKKQQKIVSEYQRYKEPILTQYSLALPGGLTSSKKLSSKPVTKSSPLMKVSSGKISYLSNAPKSVYSEMVRSLSSGAKSISSGMRSRATSMSTPSVKSMMKQSYVKPAQSVIRKQAYPGRAYPSSAMSIMPIMPRRIEIKQPKIKMTTNLPKSIVPKGFGKFPEISRIATAGRIMGFKLFEEKAKTKKKSGKSKKGKKKR